MEPLIDRDRTVWSKRRAAASRDPGASFLLARALDDLEDRLAAVQRRFSVAAALHCGVEDGARLLRASGKAESVLRVEDGGLAASPGENVVTAEGETLPLAPGSLDLAVSLYALHEFNDVPGMLVQIRRVLRPDGLFLGCLAGAGTLAELRESLLAAETGLRGGASPRVLPFADVRDAGALLQRAGFALPVADIDEVTVRYDTMFDLMLDLRAMGATNSLIQRSRTPASRALFVEAARIYAERFSDDDGRIRATFNTIWLSGWAPAPTQQQPLRPGSGKVSLAEILETGSRDPQDDKS
ncbi:MAG: methyltransferase domain-containing protein [Rhizobiaceae bacterium]